MAGLLMALSAGILWGSADFAGGRLSRRLPLLIVVTCSQGAGLVALTIVLLVRGHPAVGAVGWGVVAGLLSLGSVTCFYRALAVGTMSVVAPLVATSAAVPVLAGVVEGERPGTVAAAGIAVALTGIVLVSRQMAHEPPENHRLSVVLAVVAAVFAGAQLVALQRAGAVDALTGVAASRAMSVAVLVIVLMLSRASAPARDLPAAAMVGLLDTGANLAYTFASARSLLSLAGVLASVYPAVTVAFARFVLHERLRPSQWAGASLAFAGVLLIVSG
ncbi:DMT family transporter [Blastococcus haudaquaticus]|uniref:Glucose uptake protein GlcU n=1 Tax=Blastococcus haudaquaticus TaxID=1938745 RepID=A0A286GZ62_9ACTN|nr:DMT family transporter [Blastococcus haudaquaticus]SOE00389.1 Glucose uptake protein GlcU [Blastococcus haudaquaticus]